MINPHQSALKNNTMRVAIFSLNPAAGSFIGHPAD